jgi:hypothetical protein
MNYLWKVQPNNDLARYLFTAADISKGIFGDKLFYVLPFIPKDSNHNTVYFPRTKRPLTGYQWKVLKESNVQVPLIIESLFDTSSLNISFTDEELDITSVLDNLRADWNKKHIEFEDYLSKIFSLEQCNFDFVEIYPTHYGTLGSYYYHKDTNILSIYLRSDATSTELAKLVVLGILSKNLFYTEQSYGDLEEHTSKTFDKIISITDFFFIGTNLKNLFPDYKSSKSFNIKEGKGLLVTESLKYLAELGFKPKSSFKVTSNGVLDIVSNKYIRNLNKQQTKLLSLLLTNYGSTCSYDLIAESLYGLNYAEKFSLSNLNKLVHQIRFKLRLLGYKSINIETKRGEGYILY